MQVFLPSHPSPAPHPPNSGRFIPSQGETILLGHWLKCANQAVMMSHALKLQGTVSNVWLQNVEEKAGGIVRSKGNSSRIFQSPGCPGLCSQNTIFYFFVPGSLLGECKPNHREQNNLQDIEGKIAHGICTCSQNTRKIDRHIKKKRHIRSWYI